MGIVLEITTCSLGCSIGRISFKSLVIKYISQTNKQKNGKYYGAITQKKMVITIVFYTSHSVEIIKILVQLENLAVVVTIGITTTDILDNKPIFSSKIFLL